MIIVSNPSRLTNLAAIDQYNLLSRFYEEHHIPDGVWDGLNAGGKRWPGSAEAASASWIHRNSVQNEALVITLMRDLDRGAAECIALALELKVDILLMDEREGRRAAQRLGLHTLYLAALDAADER